MLQKEVLQLREDKHELETRVRQLEAENRGLAGVFDTRSRRGRNDSTEFPPVSRAYEKPIDTGLNVSIRSPNKSRQQHSRKAEARSRTEDSRTPAIGTSKREAIEALSQLLLSRAAYAKAQK
jgi:hypothetical protein